METYCEQSDVRHTSFVNRLTQKLCPQLPHCRNSIIDAGPVLIQHWGQLEWSCQQAGERRLEPCTHARGGTNLYLHNGLQSFSLFSNATAMHKFKKLKLQKENSLYKMSFLSLGSLSCMLDMANTNANRFHYIKLLKCI